MAAKFGGVVIQLANGAGSEICDGMDAMTDQAGMRVIRPAAQYTRVAAGLHWVMAVLIVGNVMLALVAESLPENWIRPGIDLHKSIGLTVLGLVVLRVLWRVAHPPPELPSGYPGWQKRASHTAHMILYGLMVLLPVSGWLHDSAFKYAGKHPLMLYWVVPWFRIGAVESMEPAAKEEFHSVLYTVHTVSAYALYGLLALHILGALKHQWDGARELQRMRVG